MYIQDEDSKWILNCLALPSLPPMAFLKCHFFQILSIYFCVCVSISLSLCIYVYEYKDADTQRDLKKVSDPYT